MNHRFRLPLLALAACHSTSALTGTARDELRLVGLPDVVVVPGTPGERCPPIHLVPDSSGAFSTTVCTDQTYTVSYADGVSGIHWRGDPVTAKAGDSVSISAFPAASEPGVYVLGATLKRLPPSVRIDSAPVLPSGTVVRFPVEMPDNVARVLPGEFLLLQGSEADDTLTPLGRSTTALSLDRPSPPTTMGPWSFLGVSIAEDGAVAALPALDAHPMQTTAANVKLTYFPTELVPPGVYVVGKPNAARAWLVAFGPASTPG